MRHVTLILALVFSLVFAGPALAQETPAMEQSGFFASLIERFDSFVDLFSLDGKTTPADNGSDGATDDSDPVEPPTTEAGPLLDPAG